VTKNQVDPITGLPVLPPIDAPTLEPQSTRPKSVAPPRMVQSIATDLQGRAGMSGAPTPDAMATELGKYKEHVYEMVASHWYPQVDEKITLIGAGDMVRIRFTIHSDGMLDTTVLEGDDLGIFRTICVSSMRDAAPYPAFTDGMRKELAKAGKDTESYTDEFSFTVYGQ
jgi:hypothetical protein